MSFFQDASHIFFYSFEPICIIAFNSIYHCAVAVTCILIIKYMYIMKNRSNIQNICVFDFKYFNVSYVLFYMT